MRSQRTLIRTLVGIIIASALLNLLLVWQVMGAGSLDSPGTPGTTNSYTLEDIYNRLNSGVTGTQSTFTEPAGGPTTGTMHTVDEIMGKAPVVDNTNGALPSEVAIGKTYWGLRTGGTWGDPNGGAKSRRHWQNGADNLLQCDRRTGLSGGGISKTGWGTPARGECKSKIYR